MHRFTNNIIPTERKRKITNTTYGATAESLPTDAAGIERQSYAWIDQQLAGWPLAETRSIVRRVSGLTCHRIAVVDDEPFSVLSPQLGNARGFEDYVRCPTVAGGGLGDACVAEEAIRVLSRHGDRPFFLWVHFFGPHAPDETHDDAPTFGSSRLDRYDHEIAFMDQQLGRVLEAVREQGKDRRTVVIAVGDHGEGLYDHGERLHIQLVYESTLRVPLIVAGPNVGRGRREAEPNSRQFDAKDIFVPIRGDDGGAVALRVSPRRSGRRRERRAASRTGSCPRCSASPSGAQGPR